MSWSIAAIGKISAVRTECARQVRAGGKCMEPEEGVRIAAAKLIDEALAAQDQSGAVSVSASGSQGYKNYSEKTGLNNQLSITIQPQWGFVE